MSASPKLSTAMQKLDDLHETESGCWAEGSEVMLWGADQVLLFQVTALSRRMPLTSFAPRATQRLADTHDTESRVPSTLTGLDQVLPFQVRASPEMSARNAEVSGRLRG